MYSPALTAMPRHCASLFVSYASSKALATKVVHTRFGAHRGTRIVRVCHGKLYPQHQDELLGDRRVTSFSIIDPVNSFLSSSFIRESLTNDIRNSAMALGFCSFDTSRRGRRLIGSRLLICVSAILVNLLLTRGMKPSTRLFNASYGSKPFQSRAWQYSKSF